MSIFGNVAGLGTIQPDWAQTDETRADYIRNKPDFSGTDEQLQQALTLAGEALSAKGGTMEGSLSMGGNRLTALAQPQEPEDAATKEYVDRAVGTAVYLTAALSADGWTGESGGPYTQRIYCAGITAEDRPHYGLIYSGTREQQLQQKEGWTAVDDLETETDYLVFTCLEEKPGVDLQVQLELRESGDTGDTGALLTLEEGAQGAVLAEVDGVSYGVTNASLNGAPEGQKYDFTVL